MSRRSKIVLSTLSALMLVGLTFFSGVYVGSTYTNTKDTDLGNLGVMPISTVVPAETTDTCGGSQFILTRAYLNRQLKDLNTVPSPVRIVPSFKNGVANGFKIFSIRPNSFYTDIGLQNGDVITHVNGDAFDSPDNVVEIYHRVQTAPNVVIDVERRGEHLKHTYKII